MEMGNLLEIMNILLIQTVVDQMILKIELPWFSLLINQNVQME
jgi:hypothetical protein